MLALLENTVLPRLYCFQACECAKTFYLWKKSLPNHKQSLRFMASAVPSNKQANRLTTAKSPYLLQHAYNPVDWYPWGDEAFKKAKKENKVIFLSVGYSTCHWCHVMEKESFENDDVAAILNEDFVSVKVDREERPDVDKVYMTFVQVTQGGGGGWPMSVWLTPDLKPIVGATYFPREDHSSGRPGFKTILKYIASEWKKNQSGVEKQGETILGILSRMNASKNSTDDVQPTASVVNTCFENLASSYDNKMGGFGSAPKFPQPVNLNFMLRFYATNPECDEAKQALKMSLHTLRMMANGGIHDHIAQGFHRYATDSYWHVPHFEKMLYDQAQLAVTYLEAYQITGCEEFSDVARDILEYVSRDLSDKSGGFYSAEDADSFPDADSTEKTEGAFCVWTEAELRDLLSDTVPGHSKLSHFDIFCHHYGIKENGNVSPQQDPHGELIGQNVLMISGSIAATASRFDLSTDVTKAILEDCRVRVFEARQNRPRPHLDNKMITAWNGLMISAYAKAGSVLGDDAYIARALRAVHFIKMHLYNKDNGTLLRSCYVDDGGHVTQIAQPIGGFLADYSFLVCALIDLYESCFDESLLEFAATLQTTQDALFWDTEDGGYFSSTDADKSILLRMKEDQDGAEPCANGVSLVNLLRLSHISGDPLLQEKAAGLLAAYSTSIEHMPQVLPSMLCGFMLQQNSIQQIIIIGDREADDTKALLNCVNRHFLPFKFLAVSNEPDTSSGYLVRHLKNLASLRKIDSKATAYVCINNTCSLPVNTVPDLEPLLRSNSQVVLP